MYLIRIILNDVELVVGYEFHVPWHLPAIMTESPWFLRICLIF